MSPTPNPPGHRLAYGGAPSHGHTVDYDMSSWNSLRTILFFLPSPSLFLPCHALPSITLVRLAIAMCVLTLPLVRFNPFAAKHSTFHNSYV
jgi:hypothetical protein